MADFYELPDMQKRFERLKEAVESSNGLDGGGGGPNDPGMEARVAKLESDVSNIKGILGDVKTDIREIKKDARDDFRVLAGLTIVATLGLAGLMAHGFKWL